MTWIIDNKINLTAAAEQADWHLASTIDALITAGLDRRDAEAFADFVFTDHAETSDHTAEDCVTDEQWERLTLASPQSQRRSQV